MARALAEDKALSQTEATARLLGGPKLLGRVRAKLDAHQLLSRGVPVAAVDHLVGNIVAFDADTLIAAIGISRRTLQRRKNSPDQLLDTEQSGRVWTFAEVLAQARHVFGAKPEAEEWLATPAPALGGARPIDLLATTAGVDMVKEYLDRIEYGVYA